MFIVGIRKRKFKGEEKKYFFIFIAMFTMFTIIGAMLAVILFCYPQVVIEYTTIFLVLIAIGFVLMISLTVVSIIIKRKFYD